MQVVYNSVAGGFRYTINGREVNSDTGYLRDVLPMSQVREGGREGGRREGGREGGRREGGSEIKEKERERER